MGILDDFAVSTIGKSLELPKPAERPAPPRDYDAEARRDAVLAFGEHVLDGLPVRRVQSAQSRREQAAGEAELAASRAEEQSLRSEAASLQAMLRALEPKLDRAEGAAFVAAVEDEMRRIAAARAKRNKRPLKQGDLRARALKVVGPLRRDR
jgi:hypothetical protein